MTPAERADLAEAAVPDACDLACRVRDGDADGIARMAGERGWDTQTTALLVVLAAMVDVEDASPNDLLTWTEGLEAVMEWRQAQLPLPVPGRPVTEPCGTYAAARRHKRRGEPVDGACERAERAYRAERRRVRMEDAARAERRAAAA